MADDFAISGADQFLALSKRLKAAGELDLRKQLNAAMRDATKPLIAQTRAAALRDLPKRGGLARKIAKAPQRVQVRTGEKTYGVRIVAGSRRGVAAQTSDTGTVRHPVFAHGPDRRSWTWVTQHVHGGWFSGTLENSASTVLPALEAAIEVIADELARR